MHAARDRGGLSEPRLQDVAGLSRGRGGCLQPRNAEQRNVPPRAPRREQRPARGERGHAARQRARDSARPPAARARGGAGGARDGAGQREDRQPPAGPARGERRAARALLLLPPCAPAVLVANRSNGPEGAVARAQPDRHLPRAARAAAQHLGPAPRARARWSTGGTRRVRLVRKEGRDVSGWYGRRDETCPVGTERGTRRVQLVREGGGRGGGVAPPARRSGTASPRAARPRPRGSPRREARRTRRRAPRARPRRATPPRPPRRTCQRDETCPVSTEGWTRRVHFVREGGGGNPAARSGPACGPAASRQRGAPQRASAPRASAPGTSAHSESPPPGPDAASSSPEGETCLGTRVRLVRGEGRGVSD